MPSELEQPAELVSESVAGGMTSGHQSIITGQALECRRQSGTFATVSMQMPENGMFHTWAVRLLRVSDSPTIPAQDSVKIAAFTPRPARCVWFMQASADHTAQLSMQFLSSGRSQAQAARFPSLESCW